MHIATENVSEIPGAYNQKEHHEAELRLQKFDQDFHAVVGCRVVAVSEDGRVPEVAAESKSCTSQPTLGELTCPNRKPRQASKTVITTITAEKVPLVRSERKVMAIA